MTDTTPSPEEEISQLVEFVQHLWESNQRLSQQLINNASRLEESKRELMAIGWDKGYEAGLVDAVSSGWKSPNPYREDLDPFEVTE